ncbi:4'-phosphopantetheinyl transferase family protein [Granulosicoccus antarcticus]|uniref:Enterobactin synthase component D n=1 Tax=Granulosicoccus antarcticus IMCC3135 TaxID=1192854 RepID=A0A2Z2NKA8_9GAMM|nr:4'-phosphopantetheinyl transferase superfamily protein [Granulosicoccus antarcticus]ASJ71746.1 4'-phosphopantetheinyl transferase Npt [Granulosicoccus antarcticus IMCC3135]
MSTSLDPLQNPANGLSFAPEWAGTNIYLASQPVTDCVEALYPEERSVIAASAPLRQRTFSSGRRCARIALAEAGLPACVLARADDGSVCWPEGVVGSVSHTNDWAVSAVALRDMSEAASLGVDLERIQPLEAGVIKVVATASEQTELAMQGAKRWQATALFSLKESVYKCLRPSYGRFIGFKEVEICDIVSGKPHLSFCNEELSKHFRESEVQLRMAVTSDYVLSLAWLRNH